MHSMLSGMNMKLSVLYNSPLRNKILKIILTLLDSIM